MVVEYDIKIPNFWDKDNVEFHRNESSWCADNALDELKRLVKEDCMCPITHYTCLEINKVTFLDED